MQAVIFERPGGPEALKLAEVPTPEPGPGQVRVRVQAVALNRLDLWTRAGQMGRIPIPMPHILGSDVAGVIDAVGPGVEPGPPLGQQVVCAPGFGCGLCVPCRTGRDSMCPGYRLLGLHTQGGYAEFVVVDARDAIAVCNDLAATEWATVPLDFLTAWHMLIGRARLAPGEDVLVQSAGSGVGSAAIQIARLAGARRIVATASTDEKLDGALKLGADATVNYATDPDFAEAVRLATGGKGVEVVVDHVGASTWQQCLGSLATGGRLVTCGATAGGEVKLNIPPFFFRQHQVIGSMMGDRGELDRVLALVGEGRLTPVVDRTYPLDQAADAHRRLADRQQFGKIVLVVE